MVRAISHFVNQDTLLLIATSVFVLALLIRWFFLHRIHSWIGVLVGLLAIFAFWAITLYIIIPPPERCEIPLACEWLGIGIFMFTFYTIVMVAIYIGCAFALGIPLGISEEYLRLGQARGMWTVGAFMASFGLVGAVLTLGLTQHWGEVFPRWMIGLAGHRVPIALAVVPASVVSVLLLVGGIAMWSGYAQMVAESLAGGKENISIIAEAPTTLFPVWGVALAVATLGYYYRRRGACGTCGRGASGKAGEPSTSGLRPNESGTDGSTDPFEFRVVDHRTVDEQLSLGTQLEQVTQTCLL